MCAPRPRPRPLDGGALARCAGVRACVRARAMLVQCYLMPSALLPMARHGSHALAAKAGARGARERLGWRLDISHQTRSRAIVAQAAFLTPPGFCKRRESGCHEKAHIASRPPPLAPRAATLSWHMHAPASWPRRAAAGWAEPSRPARAAATSCRGSASRRLALPRLTPHLINTAMARLGAQRAGRQRCRPEAAAAAPTPQRAAPAPSRHGA